MCLVDVDETSMERDRRGERRRSGRCRERTPTPVPPPPPTQGDVGHLVNLVQK